MTILQALANHYDRLAARGDAPTFGFSREKISYAILLSREGRAVDVVPLLDTTGRKPRPTLYEVPQPAKERRGTKTAANLLWDNTAYALGRKRDRETMEIVPAEREHDAFKSLHEELLAGTDDEGLLTFLDFLSGWRPQDYVMLPDSKDMLGTNVVFGLDGEIGWIHERPAARMIWTNHLSRRDGTGSLCLVTGERAPVARLHPVVKGVRGAQTVRSLHRLVQPRRFRVLREEAGHERARIGAGRLRLCDRTQHLAGKRESTPNPDRRHHDGLLGGSSSWRGRGGSRGRPVRDARRAAASGP